MAIYLATEKRILGQFASNSGYRELIEASKMYRALTSLFENGASENVPEVLKEIEFLETYCKNSDVLSSAKELSNLLEGQDCVVVTDGTTGGDINKGGPGSGPRLVAWIQHPGIG